MRPKNTTKIRGLKHWLWLPQRAYALLSNFLLFGVKTSAATNW
jgi:hypothetical protein